MRRSFLNQRRSLHTRLQVECLEDRTLLSAAPFAPNEVLVKFKDGIAEVGKANVRALVQTAQVEHIQTAAMRAAGYGDLEVLRGPANVLATVARLKSNPLVLYAEPNWIVTHQATSTDPYYTNGSLWGMYGDGTSPANQYGSQAGEAWAAGATGSASVYIGVIDEGIQFTHPDLAGQVWTNSFDPIGDFNADGNFDDDANGYIDDVHGWDFANKDSSIYDGGTAGKLDDHGTHVSGTIAAKANNTQGVVGVNWNVTLISGKFLGRNGGTIANAIKAVDYFTDLKTRHGLNLVATNNSWGGGGFSQGLLDAITRGANQNILFIAAAGNGGFDGVGDNNDTTPSYPSNYNNDAVIAVAAITSTGARASFSNYGANTVDLGAPGVGIWSTTAYNTYSSYNGTSMATPHVTGAAALYASTHPGATAAQIKAAILGSVIATPSLNGKTVTGGRLNVGEFAATTLQFSAATYSVNESGPTATITVARTGGSAGTVSVTYTIGDGTATAGQDYTAASGTLTFTKGVMTQTITIPIQNDALYEGDETVILTLNSVGGGGVLGTQSTAVLTILDNDAMPTLSISDAGWETQEDGTYWAVFTVTLSVASGVNTTLNYATRDGTATTLNNDYTGGSGTLTIPAGATSTTLKVRVFKTGSNTGTNFFVDLSSSFNATIFDGDAMATI